MTIWINKIGFNSVTPSGSFAAPISVTIHRAIC